MSVHLNHSATAAPNYNVNDKRIESSISNNKINEYISWME